MIDERVVPGETGVFNLMKHVARYNLALAACERKTVFDLACGTGYGSYLLSLVAKDVIGIDRDKGAIEYAKRFNSVRFYQKDILELELGSRDVIVSFETIEHIKDLGLLQKQFDSYLNDSGTIIYSVPLNEPKGMNPYHEHLFTVKDGLALFDSYKTIDCYIQSGVNFYKLDSGFPLDKPFTYLVCYKQK